MILHKHYFTDLKVSRRDRRGRTQDALRQKFYQAPALLAKTADGIEKEIFLAMANALYSTDFVVSQI